MPRYAEAWCNMGVLLKQQVRTFRTVIFFFSTTWWPSFFRLPHVCVGSSMRRCGTGQDALALQHAALPLPAAHAAAQLS